MIDGLTGWAEAIPIAGQSAPTVARAVYTEWISRYGFSEQLHSDCGVQFKSVCSVRGAVRGVRNRKDANDSVQT